MTPRLSRLVDAVLPRVGLALAVYRIGLLTVELDAARKALEIERGHIRGWQYSAQRHHHARLAADARLVRWRDALGEAMMASPAAGGLAAVHRAARTILDE